MSKSVEDNAKNKTEKMRPDVTRFIGNSGCAKRHASVCACAYVRIGRQRMNFYIVSYASCFRAIKSRYDDCT